MRFLEHRIPPPLVGLIIGAAMWGIAPLKGEPPTFAKIAAIVLAGLGFYVMLAGVVSFRRARTTVNPLKPETATALVTSGIFARTRNPMYVGMALVLIAWAFLLAQPLALIGPIAFVLYITRFQIVPEERVLASLFGESFAAYRARVRRWL
jgi:protein-S-isoprenylcysteine O-methyltransferase Ste14